MAQKYCVTLKSYNKDINSILVLVSSLKKGLGSSF